MPSKSISVWASSVTKMLIVRRLTIDQVEGGREKKLSLTKLWKEHVVTMNLRLPQRSNCRDLAHF